MERLSGRFFIWLCLGLSLFEILSWIAFRYTITQPVIVTAMTIGLLVCAWRRPNWLVYVGVAELVIGGKGYLLSIQSNPEISWRMIVFIVTIGTAAVHWVRQRPSRLPPVLNTSFLLVLCWMAVAVGIGMIQGHGLTAVYTDSNAFLFLLALPAWWVLVQADPQWSNRLLTVLLAGVSIVGVTTWLYLVFFSTNISAVREVYVWIRTTGIGEITYIHDATYRVFLQSQITCVYAMMVLLVWWLQRRWQTWFWIPLTLAVFGVYASLSRSFWLGTSVAGLGGIVWWLVRGPRRNLLRLWVVLPLGVVVWVMMVWALSWPNFSLHGQNLVGSRLSTSDAADAATARQNQLQPLVTAIGSHPVIGSGFGQAVTYYSTDPRVHGWRTTAAFELGYFDLWLKIGGVGLIVFGWWIGGLLQKIRSSPQRLALSVSVIALLVIHLTTPYLNHPLGLGWLMIVALFAYV